MFSSRCVALACTLSALVSKGVVGFNPSIPESFVSTVLKSATTSDQSSFKAPDIEINRRRNLAIISHPDSGKTTMTEKLLLYGGAIQQAGAVRQKAEQRSTASDFMEMEKERGISISATVMNFDYNKLRINILDTVSHLLKFIHRFSQSHFQLVITAWSSRL